MAANTLVNVPIYSTIDQYPTGPIEVFPPPVPAVYEHRPIQTRRGVVMQLEIPSNQSSALANDPWSAKGHIQPHRSHLPRRRNPKRFVITREFVTPDEPKPPVQLPEPTHDEPSALVVDPRYAPDAPHNDPSAQKIVDRLYVAFATGDEPVDELPKPEGLTDAYTHVVSIVYGDNEPSTERTTDIRIQRLRLTLPAPAEASKERSRTGLGLTDAQLRAARDFVAESLPHSSTRILVTAPLGRPTDAMCVVMCSLALTTEKDVDVLINEIENDAMFSVWRGEICGDEVERIQKIAKAWSWTQAVQPTMN